MRIAISQENTAGNQFVQTPQKDYSLSPETYYTQASSLAVGSGTP